jgi:L-serine deaminase
MNKNMETKERTEKMAIRCLVYTYSAIKNYAEVMAEVADGIRSQFTEEEISQTPIWQTLLNAQAKVDSLVDVMEEAMSGGSKSQEAGLTVPGVAATGRIYQSCINSKG